jgi:hypothetical protein
MKNMQAVRQDKINRTNAVNRILYGGFVLVALWNMLFSSDYGTAAANMGIALIFDPFNGSTKWINRSLFQRLWLIVHLCIGLGLLFLALFIR